MKSEKNPWTLISTKSIYENPWISVREDIVINPSGNKGIYGVVSFKNLAIGVLPLDDEYNTWVVGQYRYPHDAYSWEIPEGGGDPTIPPTESALRELKEETGLVAKELIPVLEMDLSNSTTNERSVSFVARQLTEGESEPEETESLQIKKLPFKEAYNMVLRGEIRDSISVATILKVQGMITEGLL